MKPDAYGWGGVSWSTEIALPLKLRIAGYKTYMTGKWHIGKGHWRHWPEGRGFHRFYGQVENGDQFEHCSKKKFDLTYSETEPWKDVASSPAKPYHELVTDTIGEYSTELYTRKAIDFLVDHKQRYPKQPFFLYLAHYAIHAPLDCPRHTPNSTESPLGAARSDAVTYAPLGYKDYWEHCGHFVNQARQSLCAMFYSLDDSVKNVTDAIEEHFGNDNYLFIATGDNGGSPWWSGSSNVPLRSGKGEYYEGGVRHHTLVYGRHPDLANHNGATYTGGRMHLVDWHATMATLGQLGHCNGDSPPTCPLPITDPMQIGHSNGFNVWNALITDTQSPATYQMSAEDVSVDEWGIRGGIGDRGAMWIEGDYKLLMGATSGRENSKCARGGVTDGGTRGRCLHGHKWPLMENGFGSWLFGQCPDPCDEVAYRKAQYEVMNFNMVKIPQQLFDLTTDPGEDVDLLLPANCGGRCGEYGDIASDYTNKWNELQNANFYRHSNGFDDFACGHNCHNSWGYSAGCINLMSNAAAAVFNSATPNPCSSGEAFVPCYQMWPE
jgi:hypothetical protein